MLFTGVTTACCGMPEFCLATRSLAILWEKARLSASAAWSSARAASSAPLSLWLLGYRNMK